MVRRHVDALFARITDAPPECTETPAAERTEVNSYPGSVSMAPTLVETTPPTESEGIMVPSGTVSVYTNVSPQPAQVLLHLHQSRDQQGIDHLQNVMALAKNILRDSSFLEGEKCGISLQTLWTIDDLYCISVLS